jgi:hypothetical protein
MIRNHAHTSLDAAQFQLIQLGKIIKWHKNTELGLQEQRIMRSAGDQRTRMSRVN